VIRRPVATGEVADWPALAPPQLIAAGESVHLEWARGTVRICLEGIALNSARHGEVVRVRVPERVGPLVGVASASGRAILSTGGSR
jgi:flagella basal body P-ring formation protein FlgA